MRDTYEDQLSAARYKAERDQARQRLAGLMKSVDDLDDENERLRDMLNDIAWKLGLGDEVHYLSDDDYTECQQAVLAAINRLVDPADVAQLTHSAYDLLTEEDREALRLVRSNGGAEEMERSIDITCQQAEDGRLFALSVARLLHAFEEVYGDGGLAERDDMGDLLLEELEKRLMPEGMEWPRYEDGEAVLTGSVAEFGSDDSMTVMGVELANGGFILHGRNGGIERPCQAGYKYGERVKRPAVLAADGEPLEVGKTAWHVDGRELTVIGLPKPGEYQGVKVQTGNGFVTTFDPSLLTHKRPVLDANGLPIHEGEMTYTNGNARGDGTAWRVLRISPELSHSVHAASEDGRPGVVRDLRPEWLTHTKPEPPDSWGRIEKDVETLVCLTAQDVYHGLDVSKELCDGIRGIIRRCRALAERGE